MKTLAVVPQHLSQAQIEESIDTLNDDQLLAIAQVSVNYMTNSESLLDEDGFAVKGGANAVALEVRNFSQLQAACWAAFINNPQINSHVRDYMGQLTGFGFCVESAVEEIQDKLEEITEDPRNMLHVRFSQFVARSEIEGELFLALTLHEDGFVETDFMDPSLLGGGGENNSGIYFHPNKSGFPLVYRFTKLLDTGGTEIMYLPSINIAHFPNLKEVALNQFAKDSGNKGFANISKKNFYKPLKGLKTFIVQWDRGYLTSRNVSHIKTTINWINHYENLKKWEIDHKKSSGSYLWVASMTDAKAYRSWLKLTAEEKADTGLFAKKTPGGTIILPPGINLECKNPSLSSISGQDTDIMQMVTSGLNSPEDMVLGNVGGKTSAGIGASRGPQADRTQDQIAYFERFLRYDFWRSIFLLCHKTNKLKEKFEVNIAIDFEKQEPVFKKKSLPAYKLIDFEFPQSEISDIEAKARALLGVKHGSVSENLGIPRADVAKKLGFGSYKRKRLIFATEEKELPKTLLQINIDAAEEAAGSQEPQNTPAGNPKPSENKSRLNRRKD